MPFSSWDGRGWVLERLAQTTAPVIVDGGAGMGVHAVLGRHIRWDAQWVAVEIHEPYVERFLLEHLYDRVVVADLREWKESSRPYVVLLGDVLEHMEREDAVKVLDFHKRNADEIMVSVPITYMPQESCYGNDNEAHQYHWGFQEMKDLLPGCESFEGAEIGRYWWRRE